MAKGPKVTNEIRYQIVAIHTEHPDWPAKMVKGELHRQLGKKWPGLSKVQKVIHDAIEIEKQLGSDPRDNPWTVASMVKYPIPPEALPSVLQAWYFWWKRGDTFTIREAQWVARLYATVKNIDDLIEQSRKMLKIEKRLLMTGTDFLESFQADNLFVFNLLTGHEITNEELEKALGMPGVIHLVREKVIKPLKEDVIKDPMLMVNELENYLKEHPELRESKVAGIKDAVSKLRYIADEKSRLVNLPDGQSRLADMERILGEAWDKRFNKQTEKGGKP